MTRSRKPAGNLAPPAENDGSNRVSKHRRVYDHLLASIQSGALKPGDRLPSEAELGKIFEASRITVAKAVHDLQRMGWSRVGPEPEPMSSASTSRAVEPSAC